MKVACVDDSKIVIKDAAKPTLSGYGAIIKTSGCGLCGSDIVKFRHNSVPSGTVLGHEVVGEIVEIDSQTEFKIGDKIVVRVELRSDRDMEYIHLKDMRASAFEPVNVLSGYRYQDGLGYYESTRDASTNFFIYYLPKGTYVFEYKLVATQKGDFSNGITSVQCMYAPEFSAHSEGVRVKVE